MNNESNNRIGTIEKSPILELDSNVLFLQKKSERIAAAIYLITNFLGVDEPLKWAMRENALALIKDMNALSGLSLADKESRIRAAASRIGQTQSLIELARTAGSVSPMNADILLSELGTLSNRLAEHQPHETSADTLLFDRLFFEAKIPEAKHSFGGNMATMSHSYPVSASHESRRAQFADYKGHSKGHAKNNVLYPQVQAKSNRQESILKALGKSDFMNIKDLLAYVKDCSEKTLQRELTTLLQKGLVKRTGERRWSTYSLLKS